MHYKIFFIFILLTTSLKAQFNNQAPSVPATDDYFGFKITDEFRNLENLKDSTVTRWMKSQSDFTASILSSIPNRNYYSNKRLEFDKREGYSISDLKVTRNDKYFYLKRNVGEKTAKVYYRNGFSGTENLLYDPSEFISSKKTTVGTKAPNFIINLISPSWNGDKIAISLTQEAKNSLRLL